MEHPRRLTRFTLSIVGHPYATLISVFAFTVALSLGLFDLHVEVDPDRQLPQSHPYVQAFHRAHHLFGDWNLVIIGVKPTGTSPFQPAFLEKIREITGRLAILPGCVLPLLHSIATPTARDIALSDDGLRVRPLMPDTPLTSAEAEAIHARLLADPSYIGTLVSYDGSTLAIYATFELTRELPDYSSIHSAVRHILETTYDGTFTYLLSGPVVIVASLNDYATQVAYFFPLALFIIGIVHYDAFRTWQAVLLPLLTGVLAAIWSLGLMGHLGVPLDPFNSTTPVLILAVGAGHAVQILKRYYEDFFHGGDNKAAIVSSITRVGPATIAAGAIATLSFFSLATLGTESIRRFGIFTGLGILSALIIELTLIPAFRTILPIAPRSGNDERGKIHPWLNSLLRETAARLSSPVVAQCVLWCVLLIVGGAMVLGSRIEVDTSFKRNFADTDQVRRQDDSLNSLFAGTNYLLLTIEGKSDGAIADPAAIRAIDNFGHRLNAMPGVGKVLSIVDTIKRLHRILNTRTDSQSLPATKELITQYLFLYTLSGGNDLATWLTPDNRITKVVVMLHEDSTSYTDRIIAETLKIAADELAPDYTVTIAGSIASTSALADTMVRGKLVNVLQVVAITTIVAAVVLRSIFAGLLVAVPLIISVSINFGVMGLLGIRLDIAMAAINVMAVGIGADYAIYLLFRIREEYRRSRDLKVAIVRSLLTSGKAILFVSSAIALGYSVLCLSQFRLFVQLGGFVALAMISSCLATLIVLPAILTLTASTRVFDGILGERHL